ncbi:MAG: hypothetical protein H0V88_03745 [Pyrinomonadaceae bacterium]|nr:hypothetical protein [Pyrinomonadaceae bacterium]
MQLAPAHVDANLKLGIAYLNLGNRTAALQQYNLLLNLDPEAARQLHNVIFR